MDVRIQHPCDDEAKRNKDAVSSGKFKSGLQTFLPRYSRTNDAATPSTYSGPNNDVILMTMSHIFKPLE